MTRRGFLAAAGAVCAAGLAARAADAPRRPNVIVIYTDDQGCIDAGCYGAKDLATPNLDALAARGVRFTQFYAPSSVCSPSRAGLLTGRFPLRAGVPGNVGEKDGLPPGEVTMAEMFRAAGYATAHVGKWHLGHTPETMPNGQGFDHSFGHMVGCIDNYSHFFYWQGPNRHDLYRNGQEVFLNGRFFPDLMVEEASGFLEAHRDAPFFLYFAMNTPHYPYQGDPEWLEKYRKDGVPYPRDLYAAFVSTLDARIGRLLDKVAELEGPDQEIAATVHTIVTEVAPDLAARTWYGMPAWERDGAVLVFVQPAGKFGTRYSTLGFNDNAALDDGDLWATGFAVTKVTPAVRKKMVELITKATG